MSETAEVGAIVERIRPLLAGHAPEIQGAVLADCLGAWLAGHHVPGDRRATSALRDELLDNLCIAAREFTAANAKILGTTP